MKRAPRFLPLLLIAVGGVLAIRALAGVAAAPRIIAGAQAWAEDLTPIAKAKLKVGFKTAAPSAEKPPAAPPAPVLPASASLGPPPVTPLPPACAPTPAELAKQAGLSPAELQTLQSLGARRTQLDQRERDMSVQMALLAAAEAKVDGKLKQLTGLKGDIQSLLGQADAEKQAETDRLVKVYEDMAPKDSAARMTLLDDSVRLPVAAKMKDHALSAMLAKMAPQDAKILTEKLAQRMTAGDQARQALGQAAAGAAPGASASSAPVAGGAGQKA